MQGYTRKIAYLYEYKDGEQMKSAGFVKVEARGGVCRIDIHLKSYCHTGEEAGKVYIYFYYQKHRKAATAHWSGRGYWTRKIFRTKEYLLRKPEESGSGGRIIASMWRTGTTTRWM